MPTVAEQLRNYERLQTLYDSDIDAADLRNRQTRVNAVNKRIDALINPQTKAPSAAEARQQQELATQNAALEARLNEEAPKFIRELVTRRGIEEQSDQELLARQSGELGAVLEADLAEEVTKQNRAAQRAKVDPSEFEPYLLAKRARDILIAGENQFHNGQRPEIDAGRLAELREDKGLLGSLRNIGANALSGVVGTGAITASAAGFEGAGQFLGGLASDAGDLGTQDLAGRAAELEFGDIVRRAQLPEGDPDKLGIADAAGAALRLGVTDIDAATNLLEGIAGFGAGGGGLGAAGRVAGGLAARAGGRVAQAADTVADAGSAVLPRGTGASFAGLGAGVDENLTTEEARIRAGTGVIASQAGRFGSTAETALADVGRRLTPGLAAPAAQAAGRTGRIAGAGLGGIRTSGIEAGQEFVESGGESFASDATANNAGVVETLTNPDAQRRAFASGAVAAPLGAAAGAATGGLGGAAQANANASAAAQVETQAQERRDLRAAQETQGQEQADAVVEGLETSPLDAQQVTGAQFGADNSALEVPGAVDDARESAVQARAQVLNQRATERDGVIQEFSPEIAPSQVGQRAPVTATFSSEFFGGNETAQQNYIEFSQADPATREADLRALYRNQPELDPIAEDSFIAQLGDTADLPAATFEQRFTQAVQDSNSEEALNTIREQNLQRQSQAGDQATGDIDAQTPTAGQFSATRPADEQAPGEAETQARAQARAEALTGLDSAVRSVPAQSVVPDPNVFTAEDLDGQGRLRTPVNLDQDPLEIQRQVQPDATLENTVLADPTAVTQTNQGPASAPVFFYEQLASLDADAQATALEALGERSGLTSDQAVTFAQSVGPVQGTVRQFQDRVRTALNTAQRAADATEIATDPNNQTDTIDSVLFTPNENGDIELAQTLDNPNSPISQVIDSTEGVPVPEIQNRLAQILGGTQDRANTRVVTPAQATEISQLLQRYERATGKKL